eukprot:578016-Pyramimonas_sp.AAC.3
MQNTDNTTNSVVIFFSPLHVEDIRLKGSDKEYLVFLGAVSHPYHHRTYLVAPTAIAPTTCVPTSSDLRACRGLCDRLRTPDPNIAYTSIGYTLSLHLSDLFLISF